MLLAKDPETPPTAICLTDIYHPNIERYSTAGCSNVCLNLFDEWQPDFSLQDVIQGLLFLLHNPEPDDALLTGFDADQYEENIAKQKAGITIEGCAMGEHEIGKALPADVESTDVIATHVEVLLEKIEQEAACGDDNDVTNDVTAGACAVNEGAKVDCDSPKCEEKDDVATGTRNSDTTSPEVTTSSPPVTSETDLGLYMATVTRVIADAEQSVPEVNNERTTDDIEKQIIPLEEDRTSTDSGVGCDILDTAAVDNDVTNVSKSLNDSCRGLSIRAYRRSQSLPNDYDKGLQGKPIFSFQSYNSTKYMNDNNIALLNAIELSLNDNDTSGDLATNATDNRITQETRNGNISEHYVSQRSTECQAVTELKPKLKWWNMCFPWLAKQK